MNNEITILMHKLNLLELYYYILKKYDEKAALKFLEDIKISPIKINSEISDNVFITAGRLKSLYKISLADSIGLAVVIINNGCFVTADHHEIDIVEQKENWSEYILNDGVTIRVKQAIVQIIKVDESESHKGEMGYMVQAQPIVTIIPKE